MLRLDELNHLGEHWQNIFTGDDISAFTPECEVVHLEFEDGFRRLSIPKDVFEGLSDEDWRAAYRRPRSANNKLDELPPSDDLPYARITAVNAGSVQNWLTEDLTWKRRDAFIEAAHQDAIASASDQALAGDTSGFPATWNQGPTFAHDLEIALHRGKLEGPFFDWIRSYDSSLAAFEHQWQAEAESAERDLRNRWVRASVLDETENK